MQRPAAARRSRDRCNKSPQRCDSSGDLLDGSGRMLREQREILGLSVATSEPRSKNLDIHRSGVRSVAGLMSESPRSFPQRLRYRCTGFNR